MMMARVMTNVALFCLGILSPYPLPSGSSAIITFPDPSKPHSRILLIEIAKRFLAYLL